MLSISHRSTTATREVYALAGEITADQLARLEQLAVTALEHGRELTLDLEEVWCVDRTASALIAFFASSPCSQVRLTGIPTGLLEWLRSTSREDE